MNVINSKISKEPDAHIRNNLLRMLNLKKYSQMLKETKKLRNNFPESLFILNILGIINHDLNNLDKSIKNFNDILKINPNFSDAYYNLGNIFKKKKQIDKSIENYKKCIDLNPNKYEAYNNLGNIYKDIGKTSLAIDNYLECLNINQNYVVALQNFSVCLKNFKFYKTSLKVTKQIENLLNYDEIVRPVDIIDCILNYLYIDPKLLFIINNISNLEKHFPLETLIDEVNKNKILVKLLKSIPIPDLGIEKLMKYLRYNILLNINNIKNKKSALALLTSLSFQCFLNEYIYPVSKKENKILDDLEKKIRNLASSNLELEDLDIAILSSYTSLNKYKWSDQFLGLKNISEIIKKQIIEPNEEKKIKKELQAKKDIVDPVSIVVKQQYENNPYPRWNKIALNKFPLKPSFFFENNYIRIQNKKIDNLKKIKILVAGCGTGQHAIATATKFTNSHVTAIDLSLQSLSYAKRMSKKLKINNIDFIQLDILNLKSLGKKFDVIECIGVLHHMNDPLLGWKILNKNLNNYGMMMIGLYSKYARQHIKKVRSYLKTTNLEINNEFIKSYREQLIETNNKDYDLIKKSTDFFSLSSLRDLLFHVQEKQFDLLEISNFLKKNNLQFCGFQNKELVNIYKKIYKNNEDIYNLNFWDEYENKYPRIFAGMYQFWCQKFI
tara:strand:- start:384 stop:2384 length:2001 start_codon:yes stop_codon:yes gene_type:complete